MSENREGFRRVVRVATLPRERTGTGEAAPVIVFVEWDGQRLSISGVEGPRRNGDALGGCGQIEMGREWHHDRAPFYDQLSEVWDRWHLNDMRAGCEHQRAEGWGAGELVEVVTYKLTSEAAKEQRSASAFVQQQVRERGEVKVNEEMRALLNLPYFTTQAPDADAPGAGRYEVHQREQKHPAHLRPDEHPAGVLGKPCPVCGYRYGTRWLSEEVPTNVIDFLRTLPDASAIVPTTWLRH
jgi:hypothetical protein